MKLSNLHKIKSSTNGKWVGTGVVDTGHHEISKQSKWMHGNKKSVEPAPAPSAPYNTPQGRRAAEKSYKDMTYSI